MKILRHLSVCVVAESKVQDMDCIYKDPNQPIEARIKDLLSRMTLKEKAGQMTQIERRVATPSVLKDLSIGTIHLIMQYALMDCVLLCIFFIQLVVLILFSGSILSAGGSGPFDKALSADWADMVDGFQKSALESRLGIPLLYGIDAVHGNNSIYGATIFPHNVGLGATRLVWFVVVPNFFLGEYYCSVWLLRKGREKEKQLQFRMLLFSSIRF